MKPRKDATWDGAANPSAKLSRRRFSQLAVAGLAVAAAPAVAGGDLLAATEPRAGRATLDPSRQSLGQANLTPAAQAEVEEYVNRIFAAYGSRLSASQKERIRFIVAGHVRMLGIVRAVPLQNPDAPATVLKLATGEPERGGKARQPATRRRASKSGRTKR